MLSPLAQRLERHLARSGLVPAGSRCLVALSGGGDSVALLHLLAELREPLGLQVCAAHLDHSLREESPRDRRFVRSLCRELSIPLASARADVGAWARARGMSPEAAGRHLRYRYLERARRRLGCASILTAHTADDQAETVLLRLVAGTGVRGLGGIRPRRRDGVVRPLLPFTRRELRCYLEEAGHLWREDHTNQVAEAPRTRVRLLLVPLLEKWNPRVVQALARLARAAREDERYLSRLARRGLQGAQPGPGSLRLDLGRLRSLPRPVRRRTLRLALGRLGSPAEARHLEALDRLVEGPAGSSLDLPGGIRARRGSTSLLLARPTPEAPAPPPESFAAAPGERTFPEWNLGLRASLDGSAGPPTPWEVWLDLDLLEGDLELRARRPGDRFQPAGGVGTTRLKKFLHGQGVDRELRDRVPLLCHRGSLVWVVGHRADRRFLAGPGSRRILKVQAWAIPRPGPARGPGGAPGAPPKGPTP